MMAPTKPKMYPITAVNTMSTTAAVGSNGSTKYTGLIMCAQKTKSRIGCAQPTKQDPTKPHANRHQRGDHQPNLIRIGPLLVVRSQTDLPARLPEDTPRSELEWVIDQKPV